MEPLFRLRRFLEVPPAPPARRKAAGCEMCGAPFDSGHGHVIDLEQRRLMCTCRPCYFLFTHMGAGGGKFRSVPERVLQLGDFALGGAAEALEIPVGVAFFLRNSRRNRVIAFYPSPAGATESGLALETWDELAGANPELQTLEPDVEALLMYRSGSRLDAWIVPIDACYELVGRIRTRWKGFDGGGEAKREIEEFFERLRERERSCAW